MRKLNKRIVVGTKVKLEGVEEWKTVVHIKIGNGLDWVKVGGLVGSFQAAHIERYSNVRKN